MKIMFFTLFLFFNINSYAKTIKIAVIDTGLSNSKGLQLCSNGHKSFIDDDLTDHIGHGTNIVHLIDKYAKGADYCFIILKFYPTNNAVSSTIAALKHALTLDIDIINYSAGGKGSSLVEKELIRKLLNKGVIIVTASGNDGRDLDVNCNFFPACYFNELIVVGNGDKKTGRNLTSNYGKIVDIWVDGQNQSAGGHIMSGTSQSAAIVTGKIVNLTKSNRSPKSNNDDAIKNALTATYKQTGLDEKIEDKLENLEKNLPESVKNVGTVVLPLTKIIINKKIEYKVEF